MDKQSTITFADYIENIIKREKLKKKDIVRELGIHETSFSRTIRSDLKNSMVIAVCRVVNKLAGRDAAIESKALALVGLKESEDSYSTHYIGKGVQLVIEGGNYSEKEAKEIVNDLKFALEISLRRMKEKAVHENK